MEEDRGIEKEAEEPDLKRPRLRALLVFAPVIVSAALFANTLSGGFVYDDEFVIQTNRWIRDISYIPEIFTSGHWGFQYGTPSNYYRPLAHLFHMLEYRLFGLEPFGYHLFNIVFHAVNTVLVFLLYTRLLRGADNTTGTSAFSGKDLLAFAGALLFATHPAHVEVVAYASALNELTLAFFYILALYTFVIYAEGRRRPWLLAASAAFFGLDLFLKETAVTFIFLIPLYDVLTGKLRAGAFRRFLIYIPYLAMFLIYMAARHHALGAFIPYTQKTSLTGYQAFLNIFPLLSEYIRILVYPSGLNAFYLFRPVLSIKDYDPFGLAPLVFLLVAVLWAVLAKRKTALFCIFLTLLTLGPVLYVKGVGARGSVFAERYLYLPSAGFFLFAIIILDRLLKGLRRKETALVVLALTAAAILSAKSCTRNMVWKSNYTLWKDTAQKTTGSLLVYVNYGSAADAEGHREEAMEAYRKALGISPDSAALHNNIGVLLLELGRTDEAMESFRRAAGLKGNPRVLATAWKNMGNLYLRKTMARQALRAYEKALALDPTDRRLRDRIKLLRRVMPADRREKPVEE